MRGEAVRQGLALHQRSGGPTVPLQLPAGAGRGAGEAGVAAALRPLRSDRAAAGLALPPPPARGRGKADVTFDGAHQKEVLRLARGEFYFCYNSG